MLQNIGDDELIGLKYIPDEAFAVHDYYYSGNRNICRIQQTRVKYDVKSSR